jgi:hypothetical protein
MSVFWQVAENFARGFLDAAGREGAIHYGLGRDGSERGRIERLCRQLGWTVDERIGTMIVLHFRQGTIHKIYIDAGDGALVSFTAYGLMLPASEVREETLGDHRGGTAKSPSARGR